jgi:hypothetical protein
MPKFSSEGRVGLIMEIAVIILDRIHVTAGYIIWPLFIFGALLIVDWIFRGEWRDKHREPPLLKRTVAYSLTAFLCLGALAGWLVFRIKSVDKPEVARTTAPVETTKPETSPPPPAPQENDPRSAPKHKKEKPAEDIHAGPIEQGPCSNLQMGGSGNQSTINCGPQLPPARAIPPAKLTSFTDELRRATGTVQIVTFSEGDAEDVSNLHRQLAEAFRGAGWDVVYPEDDGNANHVAVATNDGTKRLGENSFVCAPQSNSNETSNGAIAALGRAGLPCVKDSDFYMPYGRAAVMANSHPTLVILISKRIAR